MATPEEVGPGGTPRTPAPRTPAPRTPSGAHYLTRVVIFEFDQALIATDVPAFFEDATTVARDRALSIFGGRQRVQMLAGFLTELTTVHSCRLAICSFNSRDVILAALEAVGLLCLFEQPQAVVLDHSDAAMHKWVKSDLVARGVLPQLGLRLEEADLLVVEKGALNAKVSAPPPRAHTPTIGRGGRHS